MQSLQWFFILLALGVFALFVFIIVCALLDNSAYDEMAYEMDHGKSKGKKAKKYGEE